MLVIKCAACKKKLWRYDKIGPGSVLRCHKDRIQRFYQDGFSGPKLLCRCGTPIAIDKGAYYKMIATGFTCSGTTRT